MNILAICKDTGANFLRHYTDHLPECKVFLTRSVRDALGRIAREKPDVLLLEWANDLTAGILRDRKPASKVIVRVHDHEVSVIQSDGRRRAERVNWRHVDKVWFINKSIQRIFHEAINPRVESFFLPNAVDPAPFSLSEKTQKRAGLLSLHFRPRKGILRAAFLAQACPDWHIHVRVHVPGIGNSEFRPMYDEVMSIAGHLDNFHIEHRDFLDVEMARYPFRDVNEWFQDKAVVLSCSHHEGFHYAVAEGALTGAMPVVWNWPTSNDFWNPFVVDSINSAAMRLNDWEPGSDGVYRRYVVDHYSPSGLIPRLLENIGA